MGKSKIAFRIFLFSAPILLLLFVITWQWSAPYRVKTQLNKWTQQYGFNLQADEWKYSIWNKQLKLKNPLLIVPSIIEYPILSAETISFTHSFSKIYLKNPKLFFVATETNQADLLSLLQQLSSTINTLDFKGGAIEIWKERAFTGTSIQIQKIDLTLSQNKGIKGKLAWTLPEGFHSLAPFFPSAQKLEKKKISFSGELDFTSLNQGILNNISLYSNDSTLFKTTKIKWESKEKPNTLTLIHPHFQIEQTQANRWKLSGHLASALFSLWLEIKQAFNFPPIQINIKEGSLLFSDKYVFPAFQAHLEKLNFSLVPNFFGFYWTAQSKVKGEIGAITAKGDYSIREDKFKTSFEFTHLNSASFFPYYHRVIPYDKIEGTFEGSFNGKTFQIVLNQPTGISQFEKEDILGTKTGTSTSEMIALLKDENENIRLEIPFQLDWFNPLAETLSEKFANKKIKTPKEIITQKEIFKIQTDDKGYRYLLKMAQ